MKKAIICMLVSLAAIASQVPWRVAASQWSEDDARRILSASPWAKLNAASKLTVRWESAQTVQLALQKLKSSPITADYRATYAVSLLGVESDPRVLKSRATLKTTGRRAIQSVDMKAERGMVVFYFKRSEGLEEPVVARFPIGLKIGNSVDFETTLGDKAVKQTFSLGSMTYDGKLDL